MENKLKEVVVLYHAACPDGFGAAYAAWKKFGDKASYLPVKHNGPVPEGLEGKEVYIVDFSYPLEILKNLEEKSKRLVVLDHHLGAKEDVEQIREHVFDNDRSGATITWDYFHPDVETPLLLQYIEDDDLYTFKLPEAREMIAYIHAKPFSFEVWDEMMASLETEEGKEAALERGRIYREHFTLLVEKIANRAELVEFEGHECYLASGISIFASDVGNYLSDKKPPIALVVSAEKDRLSVSLRGDGSVNVADIAKKYGGGGHPNSAGFRVPYGETIPWKVTTIDK